MVLIPYWAMLSLSELTVKCVGKPKPCLKFLSCSFQCYLFHFRDEARRDECKKVCRRLKVRIYTLGPPIACQGASPFLILREPK